MCYMIIENQLEFQGKDFGTLIIHFYRSRGARHSKQLQTEKPQISAA